MSTTWLAVTPLDTIMVRDGRPFQMGASSSAKSVPPAPNTLGGVVAAALGRKVAHHIVGPVIGTEAGMMFPVPQDVVCDGSTVRRLKVAEHDDTAVSDLDFDDRQRLSHHLVGEGDPVSGWISRPGLTDWLTGAMPDSQDVPESPLWTDPDPAWVPETRMGLARHWSGPLAGTAASGLLYTMTQLRPREGTRFLVGCVDDGPLEIRDDVVPFGGRGRLAEVETATEDVLPDHPENFPDGRLAVYLATPALLEDPWWCPSEAELCAVAVAGPQAVASASPGNDFPGSRLLTWAVPAGSVFFLTFGSSDKARQWAQRHHGSLLPGQSPLPIVTAGFGTCLTGRW